MTYPDTAFHACSFNSTLVRLRPQSRARIALVGPCFNSTLVRLRLANLGANAVSYFVFQFHSGSIKTYQGLLAETQAQVFQFHSGSIKTLLTECGETFLHSFNSTLVRLRLIVPHSFVPTLKRFQFHSGSIKTDQLDWGKWRIITHVTQREAAD